MHDHVDVSVARQNENGINGMFSGPIQSIISWSGSNETMHGKSVGKLSSEWSFYINIFGSCHFGPCCLHQPICISVQYYSDSQKMGYTYYTGTAIEGALPSGILSPTKSVKSFIINFQTQSPINLPNSIWPFTLNIWWSNTHMRWWYM